MSNISKCLNAFNNYYYNEISKMANDARYKSNRNIVLIYKKVAASVSKYPFPILTSTQASTLEGVGETICKIFENLINCYKEKIKKENIDYISLAYQIDLNAKLKAQTKKSKKRKNENDKNLLLSTKQKLKMKKNLVDIKLYSSIWTTVISSYILYIQNDQYEIGIDDVIAMSFTLSEQLKIININITQTNTNDFSEMKNLNIIDSFDTKKINVNSFLIRFACLELRKIGIKIIKDENNEINFDMYEQEKEIQPLNFDINDQNIRANIYLNHSGTLELLDALDKTKDYTVNAKSECRVNYNKVNSDITYENGKIVINTSSNAMCDVILDESAS